jgi:hypothetical protein
MRAGLIAYSRVLLKPYGGAINFANRVHETRYSSILVEGAKFELQVSCGGPERAEWLPVFEERAVKFHELLSRIPR